jgi:hypothetical protein
VPSARIAKEVTSHVHYRTREEIFTHTCEPGRTPSFNGERTFYLFTEVDQFIRWAEAVPVKETSAASCMKAFFCGWIAKFGVHAMNLYDTVLIKY